MVVKTVAISDTHGKHGFFKVPDGDLLIHSGDIVGHSDILQVKNFLYWFDCLPHKVKIFICGNHDRMAQNNPALFKSLKDEHPNIIYLEDEAVEVLGLKIYGTPWQPVFMNWAFNLPRGFPLKCKWDLIPEDTDILISHGPPAGILDYVPQDRVHVGCEDLLKRVQALPKLKYHIFGHIHAQGGQQVQQGNVTFINAAVLDEDYMHNNKVNVFDITV